MDFKQPPQKVQTTLTGLFGAKPKQEPVGGWSTSPFFSGVEVGKKPSDTGINQDKKLLIAEQHIQERYKAQSADMGDVAIEQSLQQVKGITGTDSTSAQHKAGYINEAFETLRLKASQRQHTVESQVELSFIDKDRGKVTRRPDLLQYDRGLQEFRFGDIKTRSIEDPQQIYDMAHPTPLPFPDRTEGRTTGVDVTFSNSSTQLSPETLKGFNAFNAEHGSGRIRVRSNSMSEGTFISPQEMLLRQQQRAEITKP